MYPCFDILYLKMHHNNIFDITQVNKTRMLLQKDIQHIGLLKEGARTLNKLTKLVNLFTLSRIFVACAVVIVGRKGNLFLNFVFLVLVQIKYSYQECFLVPSSRFLWKMTQKAKVKNLS